MQPDSSDPVSTQGFTFYKANTLKPNDGNMVPEGVGSVNLANATLETYFRGQGVSCFL